MNQKNKQDVLKRMRSIYYGNISPRYDWMGYLITEENKPSYHHIVKAEELKKNNESDEATIENGAYLGKVSHEMLHQIELLDHDLYESWNYLFLIINRMGIYPIPDVWKMVYNLRDISENLLYSDKNSKSLR